MMTQARQQLSHDVKSLAGRSSCRQSMLSSSSHPPLLSLALPHADSYQWVSEMLQDKLLATLSVCCMFADHASQLLTCSMLLTLAMAIAAVPLSVMVNPSDCVSEGLLCH